MQIRRLAEADRVRVVTAGIFFAALLYAAGAVFAAGLLCRIRQYARTPARLRIALTPAPRTAFGAGMRLLREMVLFESLFKASKWTWFFGWLFHFGLLIALLRHLHYFTEPVWFWVRMLQPAGIAAAPCMFTGLLGLWARRIFVDRVRYISTPSDHCMLALLTAICVSGMSMHLFAPSDFGAVKNFTLGLTQWQARALPADPALLAHLFLAAVLLMIFPVSKLLHAPGLFFSPSRNQADNPRERARRA